MENLIEIAYKSLGNMNEAREVVDFMVNVKDGYLFRAPPELSKEFQALEIGLANMKVAVDNMNKFYSSLKERPIKYVFIDNEIKNNFFVRMFDFFGGKI